MADFFRLMFLLVFLTTALVACVEKTPAPKVANATEWKENGYVSGQINGFTLDSFRINENYSYRYFVDPVQTHFRVDTIFVFGLKRPLYIFDIIRFDKATGSSIQLKFGLDSLQGRVRKPSVYYPQFGKIDYLTKGFGNSVISYQTTQIGTLGQNDDIITFSDLVYNGEVNRVLGNFRFRSYLGKRDTLKLYGPEIRGNFDLFIKRKLR
jgi:hypothetical protein